MKHFVTVVTLLAFLAVQAHSQVYLQARIGHSTFDAGDLRGERLDAEGGYVLPNKIALGARVSTGSYSRADFSEQYLVSSPDLLMWSVYNSDPIRLGRDENARATTSLVPHSSFAEVFDITLAASRFNTVYRSFGIYTGVSAGVQRVHSTQVVEIRTLRPSDGALDGTFTRSLIDAYFTPLLTIDLGVVYEAHGWAVGPNLSYSMTGPSSSFGYGLLARLSLCNTAKG